MFVDTATPDYQALVDDIQYHSNAEHQVEVILLNQSSDGIQQITDTLATRKDITAVHIIGHGADGVVELGDDPLNFESLLRECDADQGLGQRICTGSRPADLRLRCGAERGRTRAGRCVIPTHRR